MGEVYRARDRRLGREVALKVLPAELSADVDRLARFEQEARSASALNHPNIVTIHEIGRHENTSYISMELVDGKTLRELVSPGLLPVRKLLGIVAQVAEGLAKAHAAGIVHRDLKPENVMVSKDGFVKILDFGLAKLVEPESGGELSALPTLARAQTHPGVVMGTVAYMSPEQSSGEPVDFRSDQFSFGSILYEALGGEKPFSRKTAAETMSAIIREDPKPIGTLRQEVPLPLQWILERCLGKDPEERYASTRDLARDLAGMRDHVSEITSGAEPTAPVAARRKTRVAPVAAAAAAVLLAAVGTWLATRAHSEKSAPPTFKRLTFRTGALQNARFTSDGETVVYGATWAGEGPGLYAVRPESPEARDFEVQADIVSVAPSGEMAVLLEQGAFFGVLARLPFAGGTPRPVVERVPYASADWSRDGKDLAIVRFGERTSKLEFPIGKVLFEAPELSSPRFNPAGDQIAFFREDSVMVIGASGGGAKTLAAGFALPGGAPCWTPGGKEIWFTGSKEPEKPSGLHAVDLEGNVRLVAQMPGELELDDISRNGQVLLAHHTLVTVLRFRGPADTIDRDLTWLDRPQAADLSRDGATIVFSEIGEGGGAGSSVYVRGVDGSPAVRLGEGRAIALSPDGRSVLATVAGAPKLAILPTGAGQPRNLGWSGFERVESGAWLPNGREIVFGGKESGKDWRIYRVAVDGGTPTPVTEEGVRIAYFTSGPISLDGKWIVAMRGVGNFLRFPVDGGEARPVVGLVGRERPIRWGPDGSLYVRAGLEGTEISRLDPETGGRAPVARLAVDPGAPALRVVMTPDGRAYAYDALRNHSLLYAVEGLK
jgi:Tol biopolymer transport system component